MRISKTQQASNKRLILQTAVDLMTQQGFDATTMKQIARAAGLGDATIYKYFPSKEKLVLAYFEQAFEDALAQWRAAPGQAEWSLQERLQLLMDCLLERLLPDREFVALARELVERAPLLMLGGGLPGRDLLQQALLELLDEAQARGEIAPCGPLLRTGLSALMADYSYGVISYWLKDDSEDFGNTTQLLELSLSLLVLSLASGVIGKLMELGGFVLRSQLMRLLQDGGGLLDLLKLAKGGLSGLGGRAR
ncbi:TetR/AcrR family transcriptional regulator [Roseateles cavernae]|uniref:TetR/AcrR family transcriptional regulator n=1 Tax=Roseateles cavernae TaxID=3153578 RepID=UPI0032E3D47E